MSAEDNQTRRDAELRERAEARIEQRIQTLPGMTQDEIQNLVHELRTHQIELELQNEELRRSQVELAQSRDRYSDLYDFAPVGYATVSHHGLILEANLTLADMLAVARGGMVGQRLAAYVHPDDEDTFYHHRQRTLDAPGRLACSLRMIRPGGGYFWVELDSIATANIETGEIRIRTAISDITELRETEAALHQSKRLEAIGNLAGGLAHHLNNIFQVVLGFSQMTVDALPEGSPELENLGYIQKSSERGATLIRQLLAFGRPSGDGMAAVSPPVLVEETVQLLKGILPPQIALKTDIDLTCGLVSGNYNELQQVLINLCTNSQLALPEAGGVLEIALHEMEFPSPGEKMPAGLSAGRHARIQVRDTGSGMSEEILEHVFEPFFSTRKPFVGTGLGLSTAHGIVGNHRGAITIRSSEGVGTEVAIYLPISSVAREVDSSRKAVVASSGPKPRLLIVDDEKSLADLFCRQLGRRGYEVTACTSGAEALALFEKDPDSYDLVVTDQVMPQMTGTELAGHINELRPGTPVILLSGQLASPGTGPNEKSGIARSIAKPIDIIDLEAAILEACKRPN